MPAKKFIPDGDRDFAKMSLIFEGPIVDDPAAYGLSADDAAEISRAVRVFRDALAQALRRSTRTQRTVSEKDQARAKAERIVRKYGRLIRANEDIPSWVKAAAGVHVRAGRLQVRECPPVAPRLLYLGSEDGVMKSGRMKKRRRNRVRPKSAEQLRNHHAPVHVLQYLNEVGERSMAKPFGAVRLEVFIEMVRPGEPIPKYPGERTGRPWYLRSFTTNPMRVKFPAPDEPSLIVYWGRWADARGETGPWSNAVTARVEGWSGMEGLTVRAAV